MIRSIVRGAVAGAAGTTVLNAVTYGDMALRGRPASEVPAHLVEKIADDVGHPVGGYDHTKDNRLTALGALSGIGVGCATGVLVSVLRRAGLRMPWWLGTAVTGAVAMAAADVPIAGFGLSDPADWSPADWASDVIPHAVYGAVTYGIVLAAEHRA